MLIMRQKRRNVKVKVLLRINTGFANAQYEEEVEIDDSELKGMSEEEKEEYIDKEYVEPYLYDHVEAWYEKITD